MDILRQFDLQQTVNALQKAFESQQQLINRLTSENEDLKGKISDLKSQIQLLKTQNKALQRDVKKSFR